MYKNSSLAASQDISLDLSSKTQKKALLQDLKTFKKLKYIKDPKMAQKTYLSISRYNEPITHGKWTTETKV